MGKYVLLFLFSMSLTFGSYGQQEEALLSLNDSLTNMASQLSGKWRLTELAMPDTLITFPSTGVIEVMELNFSKYERGRLREDSMEKGEWVSISTCQSVPRLRLKNTRYSIHFIHQYGEHEALVELTPNRLILKSDYSTQTYEKLKD